MIRFVALYSSKNKLVYSSIVFAFLLSFFLV